MVRKATRSVANDHHNTHQAADPRTAAAVLGRPAEDLVAHAREYARERPEVVALWCFGMGFVLGWKLKPW